MYFMSLLVHVLNGIINLRIVKTSLYFIQSIINNKRNPLVIYDNKEKNGRYFGRYCYASLKETS